MLNPRALLVIVLAAVGGAIAVGGMLTASETTHFPLLLIPFGTSILVVFGSPEATPAQPRWLIGGPRVSAAVGLLVRKLVGADAWAAAAAVGLSMVAMHLTRTFHPPAGIDPLIIVVNNMPLTYFLLPVAVGALTLALFAGLWHRLVTRVPWPERWW
jgi:CBS-domain-containing membrane protein